METEYFDGSKFVPATPGAYRRRNEDGVVFFSNWNGTFWGTNSGSPEVAVTPFRSEMASNYQDLEWCGLVPSTSNPPASYYPVYA